MLICGNGQVAMTARTVSQGRRDALLLNTVVPTFDGAGTLSQLNKIGDGAIINRGCLGCTVRVVDWHGIARFLIARYVRL